MMNRVMRVLIPYEKAKENDSSGNRGLVRAEVCNSANFFTLNSSA
jgi:hypothetical protein